MIRYIFSGVIFKGSASKQQTSDESNEEMVVGVPYVDNIGVVHEFKPLKVEQSLIHMFDFNKAEENIVRFIKRKPDLSKSCER